jgi:hypothetical protein
MWWETKVSWFDQDLSGPPLQLIESTWPLWNLQDFWWFSPLFNNLSIITNFNVERNWGHFCVVFLEQGRNLNTHSFEIRAPLGYSYKKFKPKWEILSFVQQISSYISNLTPFLFIDVGQGTKLLNLRNLTFLTILY